MKAPYYPQCSKCGEAISLTKDHKCARRAKRPKRAGVSAQRADVPLTETPQRMAAPTMITRKLLREISAFSRESPDPAAEISELSDKGTYRSGSATARTRTDFMNTTTEQTTEDAVRCIRGMDDEGAELRMAKTCKERALRSGDMGLYKYWLMECVRLIKREASKPRPSSIDETERHTDENL